MTSKTTPGMKANHFAPCLAKSTDLSIERGQGAFLYTEDGREYLDLVQGIAVNALGHSDAGVIKAAQDQLAKLIHGSFNLVNYPATVNFVSRLAEATPDGLDMFFLTNSGAEAVESCMKLARYVTGRTGFLAFRGGFHGRTMGVASITTSSVKFRRHYAPFVPQVYFTEYPYCYRCPYGRKEETCSLECLDHLRKQAQTIMPAEEVACAVFEPVMGEGGYVVPPKKYVQALREFCTENGILLVFDEVQTGVGRTGTFLAGQNYGVTPDIVSMGKAIGGGFPLGLAAASTELMSQWSAGAHGSTFGGHPVAAAVGIEIINRVTAPGFLERVVELGDYFRAGLTRLQDKHPGVGDVRGIGLMNAVELVKDGKTPDGDRTTAMINYLKDNNILVMPCGPAKNVIRIIPPLNVEKDLLDRALAALDMALTATA